MLWYIFLPTLAKQLSLQTGAAVFAKALPMGKYLRVKSPKGASGGGGEGIGTGGINELYRKIGRIT